MSELVFDNLYSLGCAFKRGALHVRARDEIKEPLALLSGDSVPSTPLVFEHHSGGKPRDWVATTWTILDLVSEHFCSVLRDGRYTGWKTYPVDLHGKGDERIDGYHGLAITGRCGPIDDSKSVETWREPRVVRKPGQRVQVWVGLYFDPGTWDGSDLFVPEGTAMIIVVEAVKKALEKAKVSNVRFTRLTEYERLML